ncbi:electron transfer flavoprotein subunit beta/FixA family protein [Georgenia sp. TF02-10]|uniref:electron transfer flavoprotein subunit beta/FixA family protein n=1 Tax=Georgenia sp. TF02-10 TaxID=2917725 RepID=UPI001FA7BCCE|nr:electron transfer flavoprotein subunit beta/FixA family protein [Georgenia sp. TF02-10]UNX53956.1 electron transfer flavoprotein subunit beta/FixA family protein [Georgenia sp. TF02-10]
MRIVVCVKHVPDLQSERSLDDAGHLVRGEDDVLNELDENAVEAAVTLAEETGGEVVALTAGPEDAVDALRRALQMGADAAVHVTDERVAGSDVVGTARVLAAAVRKIGEDAPVDLVVTGMASMDGLTAMLPSALAASLELPQLTLASEVTVAGRELTVTRTIGDADEVQAAELPLVLSVTDQANEPRYPSFPAIRAAKGKPVTTWDLDDLTLATAGAEADGGPEVGASGAGTAVVTAAPRPPRAAGRIITDSGDAGTELAEFLLANAPG